MEEASDHRSSPINVSGDSLTDILVEPFSITIAYVDPDLAGKSVGETNTPLFSWDWPGNDESRLPIVTLIFELTILSIVSAAISGVPDPSQIFCEL